MRCRSLSRLTQKEEEATPATFLSFCILFSHTLGGFSEAVLIIQTDKQIGAKFKESLSPGTITGVEKTRPNSWAKQVREIERGHWILDFMIYEMKNGEGKV